MYLQISQKERKQKKNTRVHTPQTVQDPFSMNGGARDDQLSLDGLSAWLLRRMMNSDTSFSRDLDGGCFEIARAEILWRDKQWRMYNKIFSKWMADNWQLMTEIGLNKFVRWWMPFISCLDISQRYPMRWPNQVHIITKHRGKQRVRWK